VTLAALRCELLDHSLNIYIARIDETQQIAIGGLGWPVLECASPEAPLALGIAPLCLDRFRMCP
jgi:hypothetical protein